MYFLVNICKFLSLWIRLKLLGQDIPMFNFSMDCKILSKVVGVMYNLSSNLWEFSCSIFSPIFDIDCFHFNHSDGHVVKANCDFNFHFSKHFIIYLLVILISFIYWTLYHTFVGRLNIFFSEFLLIFQFGFCLFKNWFINVFSQSMG